MKTQRFLLAAGISLAMAFPVFAQEQQEERQNFTVGQRFGTWGLNLVAPGLGSYIIMQDNVGTGIHLGLFGTGAIFVISGLSYHSNDRDEGIMDLSGVGLLIAGVYLWSADVLLNIFRSATYDNPKYIQRLSENPGYSNFTVGQRFGTLGLNIIPGLGSIVVMDDWAGAITQWVLVGSGVALMASTGGTLEGVEGALGGALIYVNIGFNIYRSITYNNPGNIAFGKNEGFHLSVFQNGHGRIMPHLLFSKAF